MRPKNLNQKILIQKVFGTTIVFQKIWIKKQKQCLVQKHLGQKKFTPRTILARRT